MEQYQPRAKPSIMGLSYWSVINPRVPSVSSAGLMSPGLPWIYVHTWVQVQVYSCIWGSVFLSLQVTKTQPDITSGQNSRLSASHSYLELSLWAIWSRVLHLHPHQRREADLLTIKATWHPFIRHRDGGQKSSPVVKPKLLDRPLVVGSSAVLLHDQNTPQ